MITIRHGEESRQIPLRKGLGLQALGPSCPRLEFDCRKADCGICIIMVQKGMESLSPPTAKEADFLRAMQALPSERLACQCRAFGDVEFEIENFD
ncbi:MAG: 2Fe-2S iron-sulfur cluster-binding protein [Oligoflexus sp.]